MMQDYVLKKLLLARFIYDLANEQVKSQQEIALFVAINLLQDAVELFLLSLAEHVNASLDRKTEFLQYIDKINQQLPSGKALPFRTKLNQLNKMRVAAKHDGVRPDTTELQKCLIIVQEFFESVSKEHFKVEFWTLSLIDELEAGDTKNSLIEAQLAFRNNNYKQSLISCRKAFYREFESDYNIIKFVDYDNDAPFYVALFCKAPYYARSKKYIDDTVKEPFDYIVMDHDRIDRELLKDGIDPVIFWNVWRLSPEVFAYEDGSWAIKNDLEKFNDKEIKERAAYVLDNVVNILLKKQTKRKITKYLRQENQWTINLKREEVPVYTKADKNSRIEMLTPKEMTEIIVSGSSPGLNRDGVYWCVSQLNEGAIILGYINEEDVLWDVQR